MATPYDPTFDEGAPILALIDTGWTSEGSLVDMDALLSGASDMRERLIAAVVDQF